MSYLESLLAQTAPLEQHEKMALQDWLRVLERDCSTFGETQEDTGRMARIRRRLNKEGVDLS